MLPKDWLKQFLETKQLPRPDGRELYRYRLSDDEFNAIKDVLKITAKLGVQHLNAVNGWNALFVLYAAEWWRREYDGGAWKWEALFASFGADVQDLSTLQRNLIVETGLRYWRREVRVINRSTRYLGTIATEGGLPLNQINKSAGWLGRVFKQVIPKFARLQHTGSDAAELVANCEFIPKTYQSSPIHAILGDMVKTVVDLKREHKLQDRDNPVNYLDQQAAGWRDRFPLPIDNAVGATLLSDMIVTAAKADDTLTLPIQSIRRLSDDGSVRLHLQFAGFIPLETLGLSESTPGRVDIELSDSNGQTRLLGAGLKNDYQQKPSLKMPKPPAAISGDAALLGYVIRFKHLAETLKEIPLIGGEALVDDVPWVFVQREEQWELAGLASFSTRALQVRLVYPKDWRCEASSYQELPTALSNKKLLEASGVIRLTDNEDNCFIIKTAQDQASAYYFLEGKPLPFASLPQETYLGLPVLRYADLEAGINKTFANKLTARPVGSQGPWQPLNPNMQGVYELRYCENNAILFRKKCVLLPEQFAVRFNPSPNSLDGTIFLDHIGNAEAVCETNIRHTITREDSGYRVDLFAGQQPSSQVRITLHWPNQTQMLTLSLPFPARGGQVINADGDRQPKSCALFQDQLHGVRLRLFNEQPDRKRHLQVMLSLVDEQLADDSRDIYFNSELVRQGSVIELAVINYLDWIKSLLAVSRLDGSIRLTVDEKGSELMRVNIRRYALALERDIQHGIVKLLDTDTRSLSVENLDNIALKAMRLSQPEQEHIDLPAQTSGHTAIGEWLFQPEKRAAEPWLIYPAQNSSVALRPILWAVGYVDGQDYHYNPDTQTLHSAVMIGHNETRHTTIKTLLAAMSQDFNHSGWNYLRQLWRHCSHLPLNSFDVWTLAVEDAQVLAALALQMDAAFIDKLNAELPVLWELLPLSDWLAVYSAYRDYLVKVMDENDMSDLLIRRIGNINAACPSLDVVAKLLKFSLCGEYHQDLQIRLLPHEAISAMIKDQRQELDRRQADNNWPTLMQSELRQFWQQLKPSQHLGLQLHNIADHHHAVAVLPLLLAVHCAGYGHAPDWLGNPTAIFKLKRLKTFDEDWFNTVFQWALAYLSRQNQ